MLDRRWCIEVHLDEGSNSPLDIVQDVLQPQYNKQLQNSSQKAGFCITICTTVKNLPKQILNYFATFTETKFRFGSSLNYCWTDNEFTLDLSLFPEFQRELLLRVRNGTPSPLTVARGQYALSLPKATLRAELDTLLKDTYDMSYLTACMQTICGYTDTAPDEVITSEAWKEATRMFNMALRKELEAILIRLQEHIVTQKKEELGITYVPRSTFGLNGYTQEHFTAWQDIARNTKSPEQFLTTLHTHVLGAVDDIVLYDLYFNFHKYSEFANLGTTYVFFHALTHESAGGKASFPLYFTEIDVRPTQSEILISFPRDLLLINTPAINNFKYEQVLTTPRSCTFDRADTYLGTVETFLQTQYGRATAFITEPSFPHILHDEVTRPHIQARIGIQTVQNEDKKLLDYSEIMTRLDMGGESRFTDLVTQYIDGNIPNTQEEVTTNFRDKYPSKSPERYLANSPIPINDSQKRILLALANAKNRIIVVDGPPGTGKSHTISALTYWANEHNKSVLITSHKKEALDVIDRQLTEKFKKLHPHVKPSIVRMDKESGSENSLQNTLQSAVLGSANDRFLEFNEPAVTMDTDRVRNELEHALTDRLAHSAQSVDDIRMLVEFNALHHELGGDTETTEAVAQIPKRAGLAGALQTVHDARVSGTIASLARVSLHEYRWIQSKNSQLGEFLEACEKINSVPNGALDVSLYITTIPQEYTTLLTELLASFKDTVPLGELTTKDGAGGMFAKLFDGKENKEKKAELLTKLRSLQHSGTVHDIAQAVGKTKDTVTLKELKEATDKIHFKLAYVRYEAWLDEYRALPGNATKGISEVYNTVRTHQANAHIFTEAFASACEVMFETYGPLLAIARIIPTDLATLVQSASPKAQKVWRYIELHSALSEKTAVPSLQGALLEEYFTLEQKRIEHINDTRLKGLNQKLNEIQRLKASYEGGKRFTREEADILFTGMSCVIAEPNTVSRYLPMDEEMIDILIIDEASQVSIADSISLMLRAKQVVVFGDEYQYGAVSAQNVSTRYSASYFSEIINAYADDFNAPVSEQARTELVKEVSKEYKPDEEQSDEVYRPDQVAPGTILWLKTFNIRTSTLSFAKAMANYTTSLKEHFRSFPEIISYSNDVFYKVAQLELIVNRIRTKPITETLIFLPVTTKGKMAPNVNLDEIEAIITDIESRIRDGFTGTIGVIVSFKEQQSRMEQVFQERLDMPRLRQNHKLAIWFVGDVQGEERDIVYYSFVEDKAIQNADLTTIYPVIGGTADHIRSLKMQRLNVGFSRAKDTMVFVHSQEIEKYSNTQLGNALKHYHRTLEESRKNDMFIVDDAVFGSPKERELYQLLLQTVFVRDNKDAVRIIPQFPIGQYLRAVYAAKIPEYRVDFLLTYTRDGATRTLILEYDGLEWHFKNPHEVPSGLLSSEYTDYDVQRQLELESYGYRFLRINYFTLLPEHAGESKADVLNRLLVAQFS